jgi:hypothetical protein
MGGWLLPLNLIRQKSPSPAGGRGFGVRVIAGIVAIKHAEVEARNRKRSFYPGIIAIPTNALTPTPLPQAGEGLF